MILFERQGTLSAKGTRSADLLDKTMDKYLKIEEEIPLHMSQLFKKDIPDTTNWKVTSVGSEVGMPYQRNDTDPIPYTQPAQGYSGSFDIKTFQLAIAITEELEQYDRSGMIPFIMSGLPNSFLKFYEAKLANVLETASSTTGADSVNGFATTHPQRNSSLTWTNASTSAVLSTTSMNSMWVDMANRRDATGFPRKMRMVKLFVPNALREKAVQLVNSDKVPESNVNAQNAYKGMQFEVAETLTASSVAWYGIGDLPEQEWGMHLVEWKAPTVMGLAKDPNFPLISKRYFGYCRMDAGFTIIANIHRNAGV